MLCEIYRCSGREGMYLYLGKQSTGDCGPNNPNVGLNGLPEALKKRVGRMQLVMTLTLTKDRKLARARVEDVIAAIKHQGFYLQLPPVPDVALSFVQN